MEKSVETDAFPLYFDILDNHDALDDFNIPQFLKSFQLGCFEIFESSILIKPTLDFAAILFIEYWIK